MKHKLNQTVVCFSTITSGLGEVNPHFIWYFHCMKIIHTLLYHTGFDVPHNAPSTNTTCTEQHQVLGCEKTVMCWATPSAGLSGERQ